MSSIKLQGLLRQLSGLTPAELSEVKATVDEELKRHLRVIGANGDLTEEEWGLLKDGRFVSCVKMVRDRTGLGLLDSKAYVDRARAKEHPEPPSEHNDSGDAPQRDAIADHVTALLIDGGRTLHDSGAVLQRDDGGRTLYCPRGCCDVSTGQDFGNGGRWEGHK